jgi:hypothetical protein
MPIGADHESALMAVHAAMVDRVDQGVGAIIQALEEVGRLDDTIVFVLADNGASPERYTDPGFDRASETRAGRPIRYVGRLEPGPETTWGYIGSYWANAANTPYRYWKVEAFEGGCHTPLVVYGPGVLETAPGSTTPQIGHVIDLMPTCLEVAGVEYPRQFAGHGLKPLEGKSLAPIFRGRRREGLPALYFEHEGGRASSPTVGSWWRPRAATGSCITSPRTPPRRTTWRTAIRDASRSWRGCGGPGPGGSGPTYRRMPRRRPRRPLLSRPGLVRCRRRRPMGAGPFQGRGFLPIGVPRAACPPVRSPARHWRASRPWHPEPHRDASIIHQAPTFE